MDESQQSLRKLANIAFIAMGALFVLAVLFYKERILFADAAFVAFHLINDKKLAIQENRYGSFITQVVPLLGQKLHLPLKAILIGYSISFNLFFCSVNALLVYVFRQYRLAILMALYYFLFISQSFVWPCNEIQQAVGWMFLLCGTVAYFGKRKANGAVLAIVFSVLAFLTISTHFVVMIPVVFLWVYIVLDKNSWPFSRKATILLSVLLVVIAGTFFAVKYFTSAGTNSYDSIHLRGITHFSLQDIIDAFTKPEVRSFYYRCCTNYWLGIVVFITSIVVLAKNKQRALAIWTFISTVGYIVIMGLTYGDLDGKTLLFHMESEWACIGIIVAAGFVFTFLPQLKYSVAACLLTGIFVARLVYMLFFLPPFTARTDFKQQVFNQMRKKGITKLALLEEPKLMSATILQWGLPYETLLMSGMNGDNPQLTFLFANPDDKNLLSRLNDPQNFNALWEIIPHGLLNKECFSIDTTKPYVVMTYAELLK